MSVHCSRRSFQTNAIGGETEYWFCTLVTFSYSTCIKEKAMAVVFIFFSGQVMKESRNYYILYTAWPTVHYPKPFPCRWQRWRNTKFSTKPVRIQAVLYLVWYRSAVLPEEPPLPPNLTLGLGKLVKKQPFFSWSSFQTDPTCRMAVYTPAPTKSRRRWSVQGVSNWRWRGEEGRAAPSDSSADLCGIILITALYIFF